MASHGQRRDQEASGAPAAAGLDPESQDEEEEHFDVADGTVQSGWISEKPVEVARPGIASTPRRADGGELEAMEASTIDPMDPMDWPMHKREGTSFVFLPNARNVRRNALLKARKRVVYSSKEEIEIPDEPALKTSAKCKRKKVDVRKYVDDGIQIEILNMETARINGLGTRKT